MRANIVGTALGIRLELMCEQCGSTGDPIDFETIKQQAWDDDAITLIEVAEWWLTKHSFSVVTKWHRPRGNSSTLFTARVADVGIDRKPKEPTDELDTDATTA